MIHNSRPDRQDMQLYPPRCDNESMVTVLRIIERQRPRWRHRQRTAVPGLLMSPETGAPARCRSSSVYIAFRVPRQCPRDRMGCRCSPPPPSVRSGPDGGGWPAVDRAAPSVRPAPAVAARACLMIAGQDSSPIQRARRPATRVSALHRVGRWGSPSQPVDSEQVSRWETDGGRTRELT